MSTVLKYDKKTPREHILLRPDTYIGDIEPTTEDMWIYKDGKIVKDKITYTPGFLKIFDEILVNSRDASINDNTCDTIKVEYNKEEGYISVYNNGENGIPIEEHPIHKTLVPTMIFGELLTSSNYDDTSKRITGGKNGLGGKCLGNLEPLPLFTGGFKIAKDIKIGDKLIGDDGTPRIVKNVIKGKGEMFEITQSLGESYKVNEDHILTLHMPDHKVIFWNSEKKGWTVLWWNNEEKKINCKSVRAYKSEINCPECNITLSGNLNRHYSRIHPNIEVPAKERKSPTINPEETEEIKNARLELEEFCKTIDDNNVFDISIKDYLKLDKTTQRRLAGVRGQCVKWPKKKVELDPYILGLWLGDGMQSGYAFAANEKDDPEIMAYIKDWCEKNDAVIKFCGHYNYRISSDSNFGKMNSAPLKNQLLKYDLIKNKFIPKEYLINDRDTRLKVLAGIIDTDGTVQRDGTRVVITQGTVHEQLAKDIIYLARSLGFCCSSSIKKTSWTHKGEKKSGEAYNINISGEGIQDIPTRLPRKKCNPPKSHNTAKSTGIIRVNNIGIDKYVGIEVDGNERFVIKDFTATHNCSNIYSKIFQVEIVDAKRKKKFTQTWKENMSIVEKAKIVDSKSKSYCKITFYPDLARFGVNDLDNDHYNLFYRRTIDIAGVTEGKLKVYFNDEKIEANTFKSYIDLYNLGEEVFYDNSDRWSIGCIYKKDGGNEVVSFVNGISTYRGGTHTTHVIDNIIKTLINDYIKKKDKEIKISPMLLKENLIFFINSVIENPAFSSQTKDTLTTKTEKFGSKYEPTQAFLKKLAKCGIVEQVIQLAKFKETSGLKKTDGKKQVKITGIPKLEDANKAGTKESYKCTLILTEGDSAKTFAMSGLGIVGQNYYGIFPLKGKMLNTREATAKQLAENEEINNLKQIMGLKHNTDYSDDANFNQLRYGRIVVLTDSDVDGSHIKGLLMNFIHTIWPSLLKRQGFITSLATPIVKAFKGKNILTFYNLTEYVKWKETEDSKGYKTKYYKGLGTSTSEEAKEYFVDIEDKLINYFWQSELDQDDNTDQDFDKDEDAIKLAFDKTRSDDRKEWLMNYDKTEILKYEDKQVSYYDFIHLDLKHFSNDDNSRSIPSLLDGFKPSQRKILYGAILRGLDKDEVKVAQLAGFVSDKSAYHHGEASLMGAIIGMAQNFVGSNNINILKPNGQFGSIVMGGKDAASPRYIWTKLEDLTTKIFMEDDNPILNQQLEDGMQIEPETYCPIIPMILVNGAKGIGTGFSTTIPPFNPKDIIKNIRLKLDNKPIETMYPWWQGFNGIIANIDELNYEVYGTWVIKNNKMIITELPIGTWTNDYKDFLEKMLEDEPVKTTKTGKTPIKKKNPFLSYTSNNTDTRVYFELEFEDGYLDKIKDIERKFKLVKNISISNMHLYNENGTITKYDTINDILENYYKVRLNMYQLRKDNKLKTLEKQLKMISYKVKFILMIVEKKLDINNKRKNEIEDKLDKLKFPKIDNDFNYLLGMYIYNLTYEKIEELKKLQDEKQTEYDNLLEMSIQDLWKQDLDKLENSYDKWINSKIENEIKKPKGSIKKVNKK